VIHGITTMTVRRKAMAVSAGELESNIGSDVVPTPQKPWQLIPIDDKERPFLKRLRLAVSVAVYGDGDVLGVKGWDDRAEVTIEDGTPLSVIYRVAGPYVIRGWTAVVETKPDSRKLILSPQPPISMV
jgi:hypothetical protein